MATESYRNNHNTNPDSRDYKKLFLTAAGGAAIAGALAAGVGNYMDHSSDDHHNDTAPAQMEGELLGDTPSTIVNTGSFTPIASEPQYFVTVEENLPGPAALPDTDNHIIVTVNIPAETANQYQKGQELSPQQTNDLIEIAE